MNDEQPLYRASKRDCDVCPLKMRCCAKEPARKIPRSIYEEGRDVARACAKTEAYVQSRRDWKKIEMLFAHLKKRLAPQPIAFARPDWCRVRVHLPRHRTEPPQARQDGHSIASSNRTIGSVISGGTQKGIPMKVRNL